MGRKPEPWWWEERQAYYATVRGVRNKLGTNLKDARRRLRELVQEPEKTIVSDSLQQVLDAFLRHCRKTKAVATADWYELYINDFCGFLKEKKRAPKTIDPSTVLPRHITAWTDDRGTATRARITAIKAAYRWAKKEGWIKENPLSDMERPPVGRRDQEITLDDFKEILRNTPDREFRQLLRFCWEVGCRPQEATALEARHVDLANHRCVFPMHEAKGKKRPRVIYLTEKAERIVAAAMGEGIVFRNTRGEPWTSNAVRCRFRRLEDKIGKRFQMYLLRHAWTTRKILSGEDTHVIAELAGQSDTRMLEQHYSKLRQHDQFLLEAARRQS